MIANVRPKLVKCCDIISASLFVFHRLLVLLIDVDAMAVVVADVVVADAVADVD